MNSVFKRKRRNKITGRWEEDWVCPTGNDHLWDCENMQNVGARIAEVLKDLEEAAEIVLEPTQEIIHETSPA